MYEYKVVSYYDNPIELEKEVVELLNTGNPNENWNLKGDLIVNAIPYPNIEGRLVYTQVLTRYNFNKKKSKAK